MGDPPIELVTGEVVTACKTFPKSTGLGWDALHPRAITRLSIGTLTWLVSILFQCELTGSWPSGVGVCVIVPLPKADGGYRPIGLLPWMVRVWMRARRIAATR